MDKLEQMLPGMYQEMHARGAFLGNTWQQHIAAAKQFFAAGQPLDTQTIVDYGCGPVGGILKADLDGARVVPHDPYVTEYAATPWKMPLTGLFSCDVFEHMPVNQLRQLTRLVCKRTQITRMFIAITFRHATKTLPNGLNVHLTVRSPDWWQGFFESAFGSLYACTAANASLTDSEAVFYFVRKDLVDND